MVLCRQQERETTTTKGCLSIALGRRKDRRVAPCLPKSNRHVSLPRVKNIVKKGSNCKIMEFLNRLDPLLKFLGLFFTERETIRVFFVRVTLFGCNPLFWGIVVGNSTRLTFVHLLRSLLFCFIVDVALRIASFGPFFQIYTTRRTGTRGRGETRRFVRDPPPFSQEHTSVSLHSSSFAFIKSLCHDFRNSHARRASSPDTVEWQS